MKRHIRRLYHQFGVTTVVLLCFSALLCIALWTTRSEGESTVESWPSPSDPLTRFFSLRFSDPAIHYRPHGGGYCTEIYLTNRPRTHAAGLPRLPLQTVKMRALESSEFKEVAITLQKKKRVALAYPLCLLPKLEPPFVAHEDLHPIELLKNEKIPTTFSGPYPQNTIQHRVATDDTLSETHGFLVHPVRALNATTLEVTNELTFAARFSDKRLLQRAKFAINSKSFAIATYPSIKLYLPAQGGLFEYTGAELSNIPVGATITLWSGGTQIPAEVRVGAGGQVEAIAFYVAAVVPDFFHDQQVVFVSWYGGIAKPLQQADGDPALQAPANSVYTHKTTVRQVNKRWGSWPIEQGEDGKGGYIPGHPHYTYSYDFLHYAKKPTPTSKTINFSVDSRRVVNGNVAVTFHKRGLSTDDDVNPDHGVETSLNGGVLGIEQFDAQVYSAPTYQLLTTLNVGNNQITAKILADRIDGYESYVAYALDVEYDRLIAAIGDYLEFNIGAAGRYEILDLTTNVVRLFRQENDGSLTELTNFTLVQQPDTTYTLTFSTDRTGTHIVVGDGGAKVVSEAIADAGSGLASITEGAQYLVIAGKGLRQGSETLADYRASQGLSTLVVDVEDVYDEFNYGLVSPDAIHDFLEAARNWNQPPEYLLIVGEWDEDNNGYLDGAKATYNARMAWVASPFDKTLYLDTPNDNLYGASNRVVSDLAIGRIPATDNASLMNYVNKLLAYEAILQNQTTLGIGVINDNETKIWEKAFLESAQALIASIQASSLHSVIDHVDLNALTVAEAQSRTQRLIEGWGNPYLVYFTGHGVTYLWAGESLLTVDNVRNLLEPQSEMLPIVLAEACLNGRFHAYHRETLTEALLLEPLLGSIAVFSSTSLLEVGPQRILSHTLWEELKNRFGTGLGEIVKIARRVAYLQYGLELDTLDGYMLFADPATGYIPSSGPAKSGGTVKSSDDGTPEGSIPPANGIFGCGAINTSQNGMAAALVFFFVALTWWVGRFVLVRIKRERHPPRP